MQTQTFPREETLSLESSALKSAEKAIALYEAAIYPQKATLKEVLKAIWTAVGLSGLIALAWSEPFSARWLSAAEASSIFSWLVGYLAVSFVMVLRGVLFVEAFGYVYHRFFQHLGYLTRQAQVFRRNQKFHWLHHMIIYPIGRFHKRATPYVSSEKGIAWSWVFPTILIIAVTLAVQGLGLGTWVFIVSAVLYATYVVDRTHDRFHMVCHPWQDSRYFQWLEKIHVLHHWDQRTNFTIVSPLMDVLFCTYLSPRTHERELRVALGDAELTVSDLLNWRYLLVEATPAEYAAFISQVKHHPRSLRKVGHLMEVLHHRLQRFPEDMGARLLRQRAVELLNAVEVSA
jgi:hypothetical protein